jgi:hypothetical protein
MNLAFPVTAVLVRADEPKNPPFATVDLDRGETVRVRLPDGAQATVKLPKIQETRDSLRETLRRADVTVEINGRTAALTSGNYRLPVAIEWRTEECHAVSNPNRTGGEQRLSGQQRPAAVGVGGWANT